MINSNKKQLLIFSSIILFMLLIIGIYFFNLYNSDYETIDSENILENTTFDNSFNMLENASKDSTVDTLSNDETDYIIIHITGAINSPGIVKLPIGSRIADAINYAGGFVENSDISSINLAYKLDDGQKIYIPYIGENTNAYTNDNENYITSDVGKNILLDDNSFTTNSTSKNVDLININSATQTELETIPGIGPSTALKIIEYRNVNGKFNSIEDIKNVNGIGNSKYENIKDYIIVK